MSSSPSSDTRIYGYVFAISLGITLLVYVLRGIGILTFIKGGFLLFLILLSIGTGIAYGVQKTRRY